MVTDENHVTKEGGLQSRQYHIFGCHTKSMAIRMLEKVEFNYCPFCGEEVDIQ